MTMALQSYNFTWTGNGILANLGTTDDVYVGPNGFLASNNDRTIVGTGSNHEAEIRGEVAGDQGGIRLGDNASADSGQEVFVAEGARVGGNLYSAVFLQGYDSEVENNGVIRGGYGVFMDANSLSTTSKLLNRGKITCDDADHAAVTRRGTEAFDFINRGLIETDGVYAYDGRQGSGDQGIYNTGKIADGIAFGSGNDLYRGEDGKLLGLLSGGDGNDKFIGGEKNERLQGDLGRDIMKAGAGADDFVYVNVTDSTLATGGRDLIKGFSQSQDDQIDLFVIDAKLSTALDDKFKFIGTDAFSGNEGELRYYNAGGHTFVQGDNDGDGTADFAIELNNNLTLHKADFVL
jgi:hypothetical protein